MSMREAFDKAGIKSVRNPQQKKHIKEKHNLPEIVFRDGQGYRRKDIFTDLAQTYADEMAKYKMTQTQLRKYYSEVKALEARIKANPDFRANEAMIGLLKSKVAYGLSKESDKNKKEGFKVLLRMVEQGIEWSTTPEYFEDFVLFFEAVVGFFKGRER